jgi:hypothetical protein
MGDIIRAKFGAQAKRQKNARSSLCEQGHHQWLVDKSTRFDVKKGELITVERCKKCGKTRHRTS